MARSHETKQGTRRLIAASTQKLKTLESALDLYPPSLSRELFHELIAQSLSSSDHEMAEALLPLCDLPPASSRVEPLSTHFMQLADQWRRETLYLSDMRKIGQHPAYLQVILLGLDPDNKDELTRLILHELEARVDHWFMALHAITGQDPAAEATNLRDAASAWLDWGKGQGFI